MNGYDEDANANCSHYERWYLLPLPDVMSSFNREHGGTNKTKKRRHASAKDSKEFQFLAY